MHMYVPIYNILSSTSTVVLFFFLILLNFSILQTSSINQDSECLQVGGKFMAFSFSDSNDNIALSLGFLSGSQFGYRPLKRPSL